MLCDTSDLVQRTIFVFGLWEPAVTAAVVSRLRAGDTFVDVGANVGYFSLLASRIVGARGLVVSVEPSPVALRALIDNLRANGVRNVRVVPMAVSDRPETAQLFTGPPGNLGRSSTQWLPEMGDATTVSAAPMAALAPEIKTGRSLIKIDTEGDEVKVLTKLLADCPTLASQAELLIEFTPQYSASRGTSLQPLWDATAAAGFNAYALPNRYDVDFYLDSARAANFSAERVYQCPTTACDVLLTRESEDRLIFPNPVR